MEIKENIEAPVLTGDVIGKVVFLLDGKEIGELPIYSANTVEKVNFLNALGLILSNALG